MVALPDYEPLTGILQNNDDLMHAFPDVLADDSRKAFAALPETRIPWTTFSARVGGEAVAIPYRIYHNPAKIDRAPLSPVQSELVDCLLTRHHSGYIREEYLRRIIVCNHVWIPPFVIHLLGEYVIQILQVIRDNMDNLDGPLYRDFLNENPQFATLMEKRVISYWDCYYRSVYRRREDYVGFQLLAWFKALR